MNSRDVLCSADFSKFPVVVVVVVVVYVRRVDDPSEGVAVETTAAATAVEFTAVCNDGGTPVYCDGVG